MSQLDIAKSLSLNLILTLSFFLAGVVFPLAGVFLLPFALHPALVFGIRHGPKTGMALPLLALLALYAVGGMDLALSYTILASMIVPLLFSFSRSMAIEVRVIAGALGGMLGSFATLMVSFGTFQQFYRVARETLRESVTASLSFYGTIGFSEQDVQQLQEHIPGGVNFVLAILPVLTFSAFGVAILFNLVILARRFPEYRPWLLSKADLREWKSAEPVVWLFIASGFMYLVVPSEALKTVALNFFLVSLTFYFFQGLAIMS
jgi:hypothetical protein